MQGVLCTVYCHVFVARQHGFPNIMRNMVVSCGIMPKGIERLRDAIFDVACQVKENTGNVNVTRPCCQSGMGQALHCLCLKVL